MTMTILLIPFALQGIAIFFDEFYFHHQRGLPLWERIGHPVDTFSVLLCFLFLYFQPYTESNLTIYLGLCVFSCLLVTKDEFIHTQVCAAQENWLHAVLFILHPITFLAAGMLWQRGSFSFVFLGQVLLLSMFMTYQILYWSFYAKSKQ